MARICHGFGMKVIAYDKYPNKNLDFIEYKELEEVLRESDLISLHCPLTVENYHMINAKTISLMKDNVIFVNTSRGELVDTEDLIAGIRSKNSTAWVLMCTRKKDTMYLRTGRRISLSLQLQQGFFHSLT